MTRLQARANVILNVGIDGMIILKCNLNRVCIGFMSVRMGSIVWNLYTVLNFLVM